MGGKGLSTQERLALLFNKYNAGQAGTVYTLDNPAPFEVPRVATGIPDLDSVIGGGLPKGKITEVYGSYSSGKTSLALHIASKYQNVVYSNVEGQIEAERVTMFGNKAGQFYFLRTENGESVFNRFVELAKAGADLLVIDSVPFLTPQESLDKLEKAVNKDSVEEPRMGALARMLSKYLPLLLSVIEHTGTTVLLINQVRMNMQAMPFGDPYQVPGGTALAHSTSLIIQLARKAWVEIPNHDPRITTANVPIGMVIRARVRKSKVSNPNGECEIPYLFEKGFVSAEELPALRKEAMQNGRLNN